MTRQAPETIYYQGEKLSLTSYPPLPIKDDRVVFVKDTTSDILDTFNTTFCRRQYIGTWEIQQRKLYLSHLEGHYQLKTSMPIIADWFTGTLMISRNSKGEDVSSFNLEIENGLIID